MDKIELFVAFDFQTDFFFNETLPVYDDIK